MLKTTNPFSPTVTRRTVCYLLIPDTTFTRVLTLPAEEGETLPLTVIETPEEWQNVRAVVEAAQSLLSRPVTALRCLGWQDDPDESHALAAYVMDSIENRVPQGRWCSSSEIAAVNPMQRPILKAWFEWADTRNALRPAWYKPGWSKRALEWVEQNLVRLGYLGFGEPQIEQIRSWSRACVYRIDTTVGRLYFKAVPEMYSYEPRLSRWLNEGFPKRTPRIMALNEEEGWMLIRDFGGETLDRTPNEDQIRTAVGAFGSMQAQLSADWDSIRALGVPDRRLDQIISEIDALVKDLPALYPGILHPDEYEFLLEAVPLLKQMCIDLGELSIPHSLEHGDFRLDHIAVIEGGTVFFDWANATLSHPFFSYCTFSDILRDSYPALTGETELSFAQEYLRHWRTFADENTLGQALIMARPLAALHQVLLYHGRILPWIEVKWEMEPRIVYYLGKLLEHIRRWQS